LIQSSGSILANGFTSVDMGASFSSNPINVRNGIHFGLTLAWTGGTAAGQFKIQISNESSSSPTNFDDLSSSVFTVSGAGSQSYLIGPLACSWIKIVYTRTSGNGQLVLAELTQKGY
jgi:hypothetical protein